MAQVNPREPDPAVWLRQVYDLYHRSEKSDEALEQGGDYLLGKRASKAFAALLQRDTDCATKSHEICAFDWDFVIDGQAWVLSNVKVGSLVAAGDEATVIVRFRNFKTCVNVYDFVREDGQWKVDDVEAKIGSDAPVSIAKMLKGYDYSQ